MDIPIFVTSSVLAIAALAVVAIPHVVSWAMAIIPTFLVPLSAGLHVVSLRYLLSTRARIAGTPDPTPA
jgi:hypothetical protein